MNTKFRGFSALNLKNIAIIAMLIDHITFIFLRSFALTLPTTSIVFIVYSVLRGIGRLTMPLMVFCLVEGFCYTRNLQKYLIRLFIFALVSHFPYVFFNYGVFFPQLKFLCNFHTSIIANFFLALLSLTVLEKTNWNVIVKSLMLFLMLIMSWFCDWSFYPIMLALVFYYLRSFVSLKLLFFVVTIPLWLFLHNWMRIVCGNSVNGIFRMFDNSISLTVSSLSKYYGYQLFFLGLLFSVPILVYYTGKPGKKSVLIKYFFYVFYPLHLLILGIIKYGIPF